MMSVRISQSAWTPRSRWRSSASASPRSSSRSCGAEDGSARSFGFRRVRLAADCRCRGAVRHATLTPLSAGLGSQCIPCRRSTRPDSAWPSGSHCCCCHGHYSYSSALCCRLSYLYCNYHHCCCCRCSGQGVKLPVPAASRQHRQGGQGLLPGLAGGEGLRSASASGVGGWRLECDPVTVQPAASVVSRRSAAAVILVKFRSIRLDRRYSREKRSDSYQDTVVVTTASTR